MYFVGREKEIRQIIEALEGGKNLIVSGKYGMGRTSLIKHIADTMKDQWRFVFVDFSETPGKVCKDLLEEFFPKQEFNRKSIGYKSGRFRIVSLDLNDKRKHVLVFDNIAKLTAPKSDLIRYLTWESRFQIIAIVERFLSPNELFLLRVRLNPAAVIELRHLCVGNVIEFFQCLSNEHQLGWTGGRIKNLAEVTGDYPLRMQEIAVRELKRERQLQEVSDGTHYTGGLKKTPDGSVLRESKVIYFSKKVS